MITYNDIGKKVFLRMQKGGNEYATWENDGAILKGITSGGARLLVYIPGEGTWSLKPEVVRILNPRPR